LLHCGISQDLQDILAKEEQVIRKKEKKRKEKTCCSSCKLVNSNFPAVKERTKEERKKKNQNRQTMCKFGYFSFSERKLFWSFRRR
jgi:hypothetical protein